MSQVSLISELDLESTKAQLQLRLYIIKNQINRKKNKKKQRIHKISNLIKLSGAKSTDEQRESEGATERTVLFSQNSVLSL